MFLSPVSPRTVAEAGLTARYLYWCGRSGRRYLFTATDHRSLDDFGEGVAIAVLAGRIVWAGEAALLARLPRAGLARPEVYIHLLAASDEEREAAIADLKPAESVPVRLAA